ncbi:RNA-directed DNA polymerase (Reverse transcriptase)-related family protein [Rhynchospora pubera]|nr:RNA-directed DNA polymerase (Reverse transcriptase)-related family protein [Rhynchospora pubera]KAJ4805084.1 RNA-directed DNA polymerase (Reverse transcriptase)-related family protein [Rhynchospora pubera]KAJ4805085.1 RNA-directed DNA polymerase (Reverse transcriptase)-related family protein [Rhynchospora pubera]
MIEVSSVTLSAPLSPRFPSPFVLLQYADDTLIFASANSAALRVLKLVLHLFQKVSGLLVSEQKSTIVPVNLSEQQAVVLLEFFGYAQAALPMLYLGLPLTIGRPDRSCYQPLITKIQQRLQGWKSKLLSRAGRLTLVSSVLTAIPTYFMSVFLLPKWLLKSVVKERSRFLWGSNMVGKQKVHLMAWNRICLPKAVGGLGIKELQLQNQALLLRWLWKLYTDRSSLWFLATSSLYSGAFNSASPLTWNQMGSFFWIDLQTLRLLFQLSTRVLLHTGFNTSFWFDNWAGRPLIFMHKNHVKPPRARITFTSAMSSLPQLIPRPCDMETQWVIDGIPSHLQSAGGDTIFWRWSANGLFSVSSTYMALSKAGKFVSPHNILWKIKIPPNIKLFLYLLLNDRILTQSQLAKRNIAFTPGCSMCNALMEDSLHLFVMCPYVCELWNILRFSLHLQQFSNSHSCKLSLLKTMQRFKDNPASLVYFASALWAVWIERNNRVFRASYRDTRTMALWVQEEGRNFFNNC